MSKRIVNFPTTKKQIAKQNLRNLKAKNPKVPSGRVIQMSKAEIMAFKAIAEQLQEINEIYQNLTAERSELIKEVLEKHGLPLTSVLLPVNGPDAQDGLYRVQTAEEAQTELQAKAAEKEAQEAAEDAVEGAEEPAPAEAEEEAPAAE